MNSSKKIYVILINLSLFLSIFLYVEEISHAATSQATQVPFKPNKRHIHEKKDVKKETSEKKSHNRAARIHKKPQEKHEILHKKIILPKDSEKEHDFKDHASSIRHHEPKQSKTKHQTKIARHHTKEIEIKKENIVQKTWGNIKAFFSSKKTD